MLEHLKKSIEDGLTEMKKLDELKHDLVRHIDESKWRRVEERLEKELQKWTGLTK